MSLPIADTIPHFEVKLASLLKTDIFKIKILHVYNFIPFLTVGQVLWFSLARDLCEKKPTEFSLSPVPVQDLISPA